jgi:ribosomal protein S18 acetylase RimI-like enzyme
MPLRPATPADQAFLEEMLVAAANWRDETGDPTLEPVFAKYVEDYGRDGDTGVVVEVDGAPAGAAWARCLDPADPGYGFVAADVPELSIGVRREHRGRGLGTELIEGLKRALAAAGVERVSLSVEPDNPARRIYERAGFEQVGINGGSWTMVSRLR